AQILGIVPADEPGRAEPGRRHLALSKLFEPLRAPPSRERQGLPARELPGDLALHFVERAAAGGLVTDHPRRDQRVRSGLDGLGVAPAGPLSLQLALDLGARFLEALHFSRLHARYPDDMEAEVRLDEIADLIRLEPERRVLERTHHHPAREKPEVPALGGG